MGGPDDGTNCACFVKDSDVTNANNKIPGTTIDTATGEVERNGPKLRIRTYKLKHKSEDRCCRIGYYRNACDQV